MIDEVMARGVETIGVILPEQTREAEQGDQRRAQVVGDAVNVGLEPRVLLLQGAHSHVLVRHVFEEDYTASVGACQAADRDGQPLGGAILVMNLQLLIADLSVAAKLRHHAAKARGGGKEEGDGLSDQLRWAHPRDRLEGVVRVGDEARCVECDHRVGRAVDDRLEEPRVLRLPRR